MTLCAPRIAPAIRKGRKVSGRKSGVSRANSMSFTVIVTIAAIAGYAIVLMPPGILITSVLIQTAPVRFLAGCSPHWR